MSGNVVTRVVRLLALARRDPPGQEPRSGGLEVGDWRWGTDTSTEGHRGLEVGDRHIHILGYSKPRSGEKGRKDRRRKRIRDFWSASN